MAVEPLDWITWRDARLRMAEIWDGWNDSASEHGNKAMVASLRRGHVHYRGTACERGRCPRSIPLGDVVSRLLALHMHGFPLSFAVYETTEEHPVMTLAGLRIRPITFKTVATLDDSAELAWSEFHDDLILYELPAGVRPKTPKQRSRQTRRQREPGILKRATNEIIHNAITQIYDEAESAGDKPPNGREIIKPVQVRLSSAGYRTSGRKIRELARDQKHSVRRWKQGETRTSKNTKQ